MFALKKNGLINGLIKVKLWQFPALRGFSRPLLELRGKSMKEQNANS